MKVEKNAFKIVIVMSSSTAQRQFEFENDIEQVYAIDEIFKYDQVMQADMLKTKPWAKDPNYFKFCKISALALLKMVIHARSGGTIEVMGTLLGKVDGDTMIVMDCFALPVEGMSVNWVGYFFVLPKLSILKL